MLSSALLIVSAFLMGALPSAYLVARFRKGIDIREFGSGNAGAANVMAFVGRRTGFLLGVFDCLVKGTLPVVAGRLLGFGLPVQVGAGLAAVAGHNWSLYMRFTGGRGVATAIGVVYGQFDHMWLEFLIIAFVMAVIGRWLFRETGFWTLVSALCLPLMSYLLERPPELVYLGLGIAGLLAAKRLTANWEAPAAGYRVAQVMANRFLWDRDVARGEEWTGRRPGGGRPR